MAQGTSSPRREDSALFLGGGLLLLSSWTVAAVTSYSESSTYCPSWLGRDAIDLGRDAKLCAPIIEERGRLVLLLAAVGGLLVVVGALRSRSALLDRSVAMGTVSRVAHSVVAAVGLTTLIWAAPLLAVALVLVGASSREWEDIVRAGMPVAIASAGCLTAAVTTVIGRRGHRLTLDHSMTALSLSVPLLALVLLDLDSLGVTEPGEIDPGWTSDPARFLLCGVPVAICLWALVSRQNRQILSPPAGVAGLAMVGSATALFIAMTPGALGGSWGLGSDQSPLRFATWLGIAVLLPWVVHAAWSLHDRAVAEPGLPDEPQSSLA